jgi:hypothetical protein
VTATVHGLVPNAQYLVRVAATNKNGTSFGPILVFTTRKGPVPGSPSIGRNFNIALAGGVVLFKVNGKFIPLTELTQIPANTVIDALHGSISLVAASGGAGKASDARAKKSKTFTGTFAGAVFKVSQARSGRNKGLTTLTLVENAFKGGPSTKGCNAKGEADAHAALSSRILQTLRSRARGRFRTRGRFAAGTVLGTRWTTVDRCNGTGIAVQQDRVLVTDFVKHITVVVTAGHRYLARAPTGRKHR